MIRIFFIFIIFFIGCESDNDSVSLQIQSDIDTTVARIGDVLNLSIEAQNIGERIVVFPDIKGTESMEIREKTILTKRNRSYRVDFQIVFWDTGSFAVPEYPVEILKSDSTKDLVIKTDQIDIKIISMIESAEDANLRPIKDPVPIKQPIDWIRWLLAILLLLLILAFLGLWRKRIKQKPLEKIEVSKYQSAKEIALARIDNLKKLINADDKTFYLQASFILREFIENQYYIRALEMTTREIRKIDTDIILQKSVFNGVINLLGRADLAKFAKYEFSINDRETDYNWMLKFITGNNNETNN